jgi:tetratricopeptide (TPR) repeat protein
MLPERCEYLKGFARVVLEGPRLVEQGRVEAFDREAVGAQCLLDAGVARHDRRFVAAVPEDRAGSGLLGERTKPGECRSPPDRQDGSQIPQSVVERLEGLMKPPAGQGDAYGQGDWARGATIGVLGDLLVGLGLQLAFLASINGYGRDLEIEADRGGFTKVAAAGYDVAQAPRVYELLLDDHGEPNRAEAFFFGSHPRLTERIESSRAWVAAHPAAAPTPEQAAGDGEPAASPAGSADSFERRMRPVVRDDARLNLEMGRLELAEAELDRARAAMPEDPEVHLLTGRLKLARADAAKEPAVQAALRDDAWTAFEEAVRLDPGRPAPHRELGLLAYRGGDHERACAELRRYVELAPEADDAARVRDYLLELDADGRCGEAR